MPSSIHGRPSKLKAMKEVVAHLSTKPTWQYVHARRGFKGYTVLAGQFLEAQQHNEWCTVLLSLTGKAESPTSSANQTLPGKHTSALLACLSVQELLPPLKVITWW